MNKIYKYVLSIIIIAGFIYCIINVNINNNKINGISTYNDNSTNESLKYVTIQEIRDTKEEVVNELEDGKYTNLTAKDMYVYVSSEDEVCNMREYAPGLYHGITDPMEMYKMQMDIIHYYLGEDLLEEWIVDGNSGYENEYGGVSLYENKVILEKLQQGIYDEICRYHVDGYSLPYMTYGAWSNVEGDNRYVHLAPDFSYTVVIKGKLMDISGDTSEDPESNYEALAIYYPETDNIDDEYELQNGKISIRDAITFVEDYFKNKLPYDISVGAEKKVAKVGVYEISEGNLCLEFTIVRVLNGMETEYGPMYRWGAPDSYTDESCRVMMVDIDDIDEYMIYNNTLKFEKEGESVSKVVSLESALRCVSDKIGRNSVYNITEARMAYRRRIINDMQFVDEYECIPCWIIRCENQTDGRETIFYINLINGSIDYKTSLS